MEIKNKDIQVFDITNLKYLAEPSEANIYALSIKQEIKRRKKSK